MAKIISGKEVSAQVKERVRLENESLKSKGIQGKRYISSTTST